ncbi:AAA family ATPase [Anaerolentibacter hominis]|uniref:AAA family ATPase n=1 Tax=Anaerolentibacter hominis TaxID=3079009 RepID=UPI0031B80B5E
MKKYIIYAGVNGAGKSTLYETRSYQHEIPRINTDEILREFGDWRNTADLMKAGKIAVERLNSYLKKGITFNQETTLCGHTIFHTIRQAKEAHYVIELHYVGVNSPTIAKQRVADRVVMGGHGIPDKDVDKRFFESLKNLHEIIELCDLAALYDNTNEFRRFAIYKGGELVIISKELPEWYQKWLEGIL